MSAPLGLYLVLDVEGRYAGPGVLFCCAGYHRIGSDIVIIARTDSLQQHGYEESLARLRAARDAGGEMSAPLGLHLVLDVEGRYAGPGVLLCCAGYHDPRTHRQ
jgi:hypothetical protein